MKRTAAAAELQWSDLVTRLDGTPIYKRGCSSVSDYSDGDSMQLTARRGDKTSEVDVGVVNLVP